MENSKNEVMDLEKYKNDGWGLSRKEMSELLTIFKEHKKDSLKVVEFGSGNSTRFLVDVVLEGIKNLQIVSFDDNPKFAYQNTDNHKFIDLKIRSLVECSDDDYNQMFVTRKYDTKVMLDKTTPLTTRQKNNLRTQSRNFENLQQNDQQEKNEPHNKKLMHLKRGSTYHSTIS